MPDDTKPVDLSYKDLMGLLSWMREHGWLVAVHNDYEYAAEFRTFWLFTHKATGRYVKGEGISDVHAVREAALKALMFQNGK